jgi:carbamoyl-phosphate synthase large subunit
LHVATALPDARTVRRCLDKFESYRLWRAAGIRVPATMRVDNRDALRIAFASFGPRIWLRNSQGAAGKGALPTSDFEQAAAWIDFCDGWGEFTAAACLGDESVAWQSLWQKGRLLVAQSRLRKCWAFGNRSPSGVTGLTGTGVTIADPDLDELALRCVKAVDTAPDGIYSVDFTYDHDGVPNPTEINIGRFFTTHYFFSRAGVNFPDIFVKRSLGLDVRLPEPRVNPLAPGLAWVRGLDSEPVLTTERAIDVSEKVLAELRTTVRESECERSLQTS